MMVKEWGYKKSDFAPTKPVVFYHIAVNGVPHCQARMSRLHKESGSTAQQMIESSCMCGYGPNKEAAEGDAARLALVLPAAEVKVVEGECGDDPWWQTPDGLAAIKAEQDWEASR